MDNFFDEVEVLLRQNFSLEITKIHTILSTSLNTREASSDYIEEPQQHTTSDDVTKAFRRISMLTHPDRNI